MYILTNQESNVFADVPGQETLSLGTVLVMATLALLSMVTISGPKNNLCSLELTKHLLCGSTAPARMGIGGSVECAMEASVSGMEPYGLVPTPREIYFHYPHVLKKFLVMQLVDRITVEIESVSAVTSRTIVLCSIYQPSTN